MKVKVAGKTHIGLKRKRNEDCLLVAAELGLYVIADGMGGHTAGEVASRMVVETMADYWNKVNEGTPPAILETMDEDLPEEARHLINSISLTNIIIHEAQKRPEYHKMGSTVSALLVGPECLWSANVGDSPVYLFDQGRLIRVSEEHSVEAEQKTLGITDPIASTSPMLKNVLTRVLGLHPKVEVYLNPIKPDAGDVIMLCSDGLTNYVTEEVLKKVLSNAAISIEQKVEALIDLAIGGGGGDNITVILVEVAEEGKWKRFKKRFMVKG